MSDTVIRVENLGKKYILAHQQEGQPYTALPDVIANGARGLTQWLRQPGLKQEEPWEEFWALKDVSLTGWQVIKLYEE